MSHGNIRRILRSCVSYHPGHQVHWIHAKKAHEPQPEITVVGRRTYRSLRRAEAGGDTRRRILDAAMARFVDHGYGRVTVGDIARDAEVAVPTVYASTGGKAAILATLIDKSMRDPVVDETLAAIRKSTTPTDVVRITAHGVRVHNERYHDIIQVMKTAAVIDDSATDILIRSDRGYRDSLAQTADRLREMQALATHLADRQAVDIRWFYLGHEAWHVLVSERQWSWDDAELWLGELAAAALVETSRA